MQKMTKLKRFFVILLSVVMFTSPTLFAGCEYVDITANRKDPLDFEKRYGDSYDDTDNLDPNQPNPANKLSYKDYINYFKNYRLTYKPGDVEREDFNENIKKQNEDVAGDIILKLEEKYGTNSLFKEPVSSITASNTENVFYVKDKDGTPYYYMVRQKKDGAVDNVKYFSHADVYQTFSTDNIKNKLQLAQALILSGNYINSEDEEKNTFDAIYNTYSSSSILIGIAINQYISEINHLGYTKEEVEQLSTFVLNYIIGADKVAEDNNRFVNAYCDINGNVNIVYYGASTNDSQKNEYYNRFLTDETYATGVVSNGELIFTIPDEDDNNLEGLLYYSGEYLKKASLAKSFDYNTVEVLGSTSTITVEHQYDENSDTDDVNISEPVFNKLIATDYRDGFNGNVWGRADKNGVVQNYVEYDVGVNNYSYAVFSVRLPYFKNYFNTVHFMIEDLLWKQVDDLTEAERQNINNSWKENHPDMDAYPYAEVFPTVPLTYFADYDNADMLFNGLSVTHMFSGYQAYQSMVIMPQQDVYAEEVSLWFVRQLLLSELVDGKTTNGSGDFELTVYARYFDYESQSYATWGDGEEESEFYYIDTINVTFNPVYDNFGNIKNCVPTYLQISIKDILNSAKISGTERNSYLLKAFPENEKVMTHQTNLLSKDNYGWWFNQYSTPQGDTVVCFDGKNMASQSYLEFVISNKTNSRFQFCVYPDICYHT